MKFARSLTGIDTPKSRMNAAMNENQKSVLFVCLGNICRSPTGEGVFQHLLDELGIAEQFSVDSAGTAGYHIGARADARMREHASRRGYALASRARKIVVTALLTFDLIIPMDRENLTDIQRLVEQPTAEIKLLSEFLTEDWPTDVPDPYYGGADGVEFVVDMIEAACPRILEYLKS